MQSTPFGQYVRRRRREAGLSLRAVADRLGVTHVYLGEVERGASAPLKKDHWEKLIIVIKTGAAERGHEVQITMQELEDVAVTSRPIQMKLADAPRQYQELGIALARRIEQRDLPQQDLDEILRMLKGDR